MTRRILKGAGVWALTMGICMALMWAVCALIPQSSIQRSSERSADYFSGRGTYYLLAEGRRFTLVDNYSDCVLLNVIYNIDSSDALRSMIRAQMHHIEGEDCRADYRSAVYEGAEPDNSYSRYWHGSQVLLRPLLTFVSIEGCRRILFGLLMALNAVLCALLVRRSAVRALLVYVAGMLMIHFWMAYFAIQFVTTLLVSSGACIAVALLWRGDMPMERRMSRMTAICIVSGACVCFMDFLTCETVAFSIPAILWLMLYAERRGERLSIRAMTGAVCRWGGAWLAAYAAAFALKWLLVLLVMGPDGFREVFTHAAVRVNDVLDVFEDGRSYTVMETGVGLLLARNIACLIPGLENQTVGGALVIAAGIAALVGLCLYIFGGSHTDIALMLALVLVALVPFARLVLLASHSLTHYFFTYRALIAPAMALPAMLVYGTARGKKKKRR